MRTSIFRFITIIILSLTLFLSCQQPSPLYGTWADNAGSSIVFMNDDTFSATIVQTSGSQTTKTSYSGDYTVLLNTIVFSMSYGKTVVSEWDIRGNILYLDWTDEDGNSLALNLYKTAN